MSNDHVPQLTAGIDPRRFSDHLIFAADKRVAAGVLALFMLIGLGLRMDQLGAESLGEDEFNKLQTVAEYRTNGLSGKNGEHPFLMKALQTVSVAGAEKLNTSFGTQFSEEGSLRFPIALFGTFTALLLYLLASELFGRSIGLVAGVLWAIEPMAVGFDRIAKEDSLALFFFLLTNLFWLKSQSKAERGEAKWLSYVWLAGCSFAALMASKYYPHLLGVTAGYYVLFQTLPGNKWALGPKRWLQFVMIMGAAFLLLNWTIVLPDAWREMLKFSSENRIGHDSYEYMGRLYPHKMTSWLSGVPWTFYYVLIGVKTSLSTLILFLIGLPLLFKRKLADGRFFIAIWAFMWFLPYTVLGGKFIRYFTMAEPIILIGAAVGLYFSLKWIADRLSGSTSAAIQVAALLLVAAFPIVNSVGSGPHYRLFTNAVGKYFAAPGRYFPHDEFYDTSTRDVVEQIVLTAPLGARIASETPSLFDYYAARRGRPDIRSVSLSDTAAVQELDHGDFVVLTEGRRYLSNEYQWISYTEHGNKIGEITASGSISSRIYAVDPKQHGLTR